MKKDSMTPEAKMQTLAHHALLALHGDMRTRSVEVHFDHEGQPFKAIVEYDTGRAWVERADGKGERYEVSTRPAQFDDPMAFTASIRHQADRLRSYERLAAINASLAVARRRLSEWVGAEVEGDDVTHYTVTTTVADFKVNGLRLLYEVNVAERTIELWRVNAEGRQERLARADGQCWEHATDDGFARQLLFMLMLGDGSEKDTELLKYTMGTTLRGDGERGESPEDIWCIALLEVEGEPTCATSIIRKGDVLNAMSHRTQGEHAHEIYEQHVMFFEYLGGGRLP